MPNETKHNLPANFLLGAASSSHQVEGNNIHNDWWFWEQKGKLPASRVATDHFNRYKEDFVLAKQIGLNAMRISIEWSRIEPVEGKFDSAAVEHYRKVLQNMEALGLTRMVTLFHFTLPLWFANKGGFEKKKNISLFVRYAQFVVHELQNEVNLWATINEPEVYSGNSYRVGVWPPFVKNIFTSGRVFSNLAKAHIAAYEAIKKTTPKAVVGLAKNNVYYEPSRSRHPLDRVATYITHWFGNRWWLNKLNNKFDFLGLNYYFYHSLKFNLLKGVIHVDKTAPKSDMGWRTWPEGIYHLTTDLWSTYNKPIYITENGIANARDDMRQDFIEQHLLWVEKAIHEGADVRGYFYWSLTDTYEWQDGYNPKFGLIEVNFESQVRTVRPSSEIFKKIRP